MPSDTSHRSDATRAKTRGRSLAFSPDAVLPRMMRLFWEQGFEHTSYDDLVKVTGVQRYGLYRAFGDKLSAFTHALGNYVSQVREFTEPLRNPEAGLPEIQDYFRRLLEANREKPIGCMVCNTASLPISADPGVSERMRQMLDLVRTSLEHAAGNALASGQITPRFTAEELGHQLLGTMVAMTVLLQSPLGIAAAEEHVRAALNSISS